MAVQTFGVGESVRGVGGPRVGSQRVRAERVYMWRYSAQGQQHGGSGWRATGGAGALPYMRTAYTVVRVYGPRAEQAWRG